MRCLGSIPSAVCGNSNLTFHVSVEKCLKCQAIGYLKGKGALALSYSIIKEPCVHRECTQQMLTQPTTRTPSWEGEKLGSISVIFNIK